MELKRCPFCGGRPFLNENKAINSINIECFSCGVSTISLQISEKNNDITQTKNTLTKL